MSLNVERAELVEVDGRPGLRLVIDGAVAWVYEPKRSLLDLLDAENEYFQASRAFSNAHFNLVDARARYLAAAGRLLEYFKVSRKDVPAPETLGVKPETYKSWTTGGK